MLSHYSFINVYPGLLVWSGWTLLSADRDRKSALRRLAALHAAPIAFLATLYPLVLRRMVVGSGPELPLLNVVGETVALTLGAPLVQPAIALAAVTASSIVALDSWALHREGSNEWLFLLVVVAVAPAVSIAIFSPTVLFVRYFLLSAVFLLLALSRVLGRGFDRRGGARLVAIVLITLVVAGNLTYAGRFLQYGRGRHLQALEYMDDRTPGDVITVGGDYDSGNRLVLRFYERYLETAKTFVYVDRQAWTERRPMWFLTHSGEVDPQPPPELWLAPDQHYVLEEWFPFYGLSGWHWLLYRRASG